MASGGKKRGKGDDSTIVANRRARFDYEFSDTLEAGMVLTGSEVKSLRAGSAHLKDAYAAVRGGEAWLLGMHIGPYVMAREGGHKPERPRKLLLNSKEIARLAGRVQEGGLTIIPIKLYWKSGKVKVLLGVGRRARDYDKRQKIRAREVERETRQAKTRKGRL